MKRLLIFVFSLFLAACNSSNNGNKTRQVANPLTMNCLNGNAYCNGNIYNQNNNYGWTSYPGMYNYAYNYTNTFNQSGFCNCPNGYMPTYNGTYGLGCVNSQLVQPYVGYYFYWVWGGYGTYGYYSYIPQMSNNWPQYSNVYGNNYNSSSCTRNLTQSCLLNQMNSCGIGATCRQVSIGSTLGICVNY